MNNSGETTRHVFSGRIRIVGAFLLCLAVAFTLFAVPMQAQAATKNGLVKEGNYYYYYESGKKITGWKKVNDDKYYFLSSGKAATGIKKIGSYTYYFSDAGKMQKGYKKVTVGDTTKYFYLASSSGKSLKGIYAIPDRDYSYYFDGNGAIAQDTLKKVGDYYYYFGSSGKMATKTLKKVGSYYYYFGEDGKAVTGWKKINGYKYHFSSSGKAATGAKKIGSYTYYFSDAGKMQTGYKKVTVGDTTKYFYLASSSGKSLKGIYAIPGRDYSYYFDGNGAIAKDEIKTIKGSTYYFSSSGILLKNSFKTYKGTRYYFGESGAAHTGWSQINGETYFFLETGASATGLTQIDGDWYYFNPSNYKMTKGYRKIDDKYFYFDTETGKSLSGVFQVGTNDYEFYFNGDGTIPKSSFITANGMLLFATKDGKICKDNWRNAGTTDLNGSSLYIHCDAETGEVSQGMTTFTRTSDGAECTYYFDKDVENGYRVGMVTADDGETYWFTTSQNIGKLNRGFYTDLENGSHYYFDTESGALQTSGTVDIPGTTVQIPVNDDGTLGIDAVTQVGEGDSPRTKLVKYALSQLGKPYGHPAYTSELMIPLSQVASYNCSGFVMRMYYEVTGSSMEDRIDIFGKNNDLVLLDSMSLFDDPSSAIAGDIVFFNMENCAESESDEAGNPWLIDNDGDGVCDRIHDDIVVGEGRAHVHHVGIYLGNGQMVHAAVGRGVVLQSISDNANTNSFYLFCYGNTNTLD